MTVLGVLGGSGIYELEGLQGARWEPVRCAYGKPSDDLLRGELGGLEYVFLPRHGRGHVFSPGAIDYRANIEALKRAGVTDLVSLSACGSLRESLAPGSLVLVDQYVDRTDGRARTFFDAGVVAHVSLADPVCSRLHDALQRSAESAGISLVRGGTYLAMEGPQFSSRAESELYRQWGCDVIGMTNMPEARLAREAELCYASVAMVTDYDCWHPAESDVQVSDIVGVMNDNAARGRELVAGLAAELQGRSVPCTQGCDRALDQAVITPPDARDAAALTRLEAVAGRVL